MEPSSYDYIVGEKGVHRKEAEEACALQLLNQTQSYSDQTQGVQDQCALQLPSQTPIGQCSVQLLSQTPGDQFALQPLSAHQLQMQLIQHQMTIQQQQLLLEQQQQQLNQVPTQSHRESFLCAVALSCCVIWTCLFGCVCGVVAIILAVVGNEKSSNGDQDGARALKKASYILSSIGLIFGAVIFIAVVSANANSEKRHNF